MSYLFSFLKYLLLGIEFALVSLFTFIVGLLPLPWIRNVFPKLYQFWSRTFLRFLGIREHVHQKYDQPIPSHYILISNHPSGIELLWIPSLFKVIPLSKEEIGDWFIVGRLTKALGTIFVKRDKKDSRHAAIKGCFDATKAGKSLMLFPEGGCYGKNLNPFFIGAFRISKELNVPILPVFVYYEEQHTYHWDDIGAMEFLSRVLFKAHNRNAHLYIFDAVYPDKYADAEAFHDAVYEMYKKIEEKYRA
jgi:1-acyl-sn-glycerol-3-phosphate acyltransferase